MSTAYHCQLVKKSKNHLGIKLFVKEAVLSFRDFVLSLGDEKYMQRFVARLDFLTKNIFLKKWKHLLFTRNFLKCKRKKTDNAK